MSLRGYISFKKLAKEARLVVIHLHLQCYKALINKKGDHDSAIQINKLIFCQIRFKIIIGSS